MIKLEDLKVGDIIYKTYKYHWLRKLQITEEKRPFEYQSSDMNAPTTYCVVCKTLSSNTLYNKDQLFDYDESELFKTEDEAIQYQQKCRQEKIDYLSKDNNLIKILFEQAKRFINEADMEIYEELINGMKEKEN